MKKPIFLLLLLILVLGGVFVPQQAVSALAGGQDDRGHAYVGLVTDFESTCVGVSLSDRVILTSAGCFEEDGQQVWVTLDATAVAPEKPNLVSGEWIAHPDACVGCPPGLARKSPDVAVVILDEALPLAEYASLPVFDDFLNMTPGKNVDVPGYQVGALRMDDGLLRADFRRHFVQAVVLPPGLGSGSLFRVQSLLSSGQACFLTAGSPVLGENSHVVLGLLSAREPSSCSRTAAVYALNDEAALQFLQEAVFDPAGLKARHDS